MTDGIIQKVFTKWKKYSNTQQCRQDIIDIEQELIEEIKKELEFHDCYMANAVLQKLIGDYQE